MISATSNRNDPEMVEYHRLLTDVITIFWQFHKERVAEGKVPFAIELDVEHQQRNSSVLDRYSYAVTISLQKSWSRLLEGLAVPGVVPDPKSAWRFKDEYVVRLIDYAEKLAETKTQVRDLIGHAPEFEQVVTAGVRTGTAVTSRLAAIFQEEFLPVKAVLVSRVSIDHVGEASVGLGILSDRFPRSPLVNYPLLDGSKLGLDVKQLRAYGSGDALGCPAGRLASAETQAFLLERGVDVRRTTMLEDFAAMIGEHFETTIMAWYRGLTPEEQEQRVIGADNLILSGEVRRAFVERDRGRCPYPAERR